MRLTDLEPVFVQYGEHMDHWNEVVGDPLTWKPGDPEVACEGMHEFTAHADDAGQPFNLAAAHGVRFRCPGLACNRGHLVDVTFAGHGVPDNLGSHARDGRPSRWQVSGTGFGDLTLQPSVDVGTPSCWHGFVTGGEVT